MLDGMDLSTLLNGIGTVGLAVLIMYMIASGKLVTRREADTYREDRDLWRAAYDAKAASEVMTKEQFNELLEGSRTSRAFIESFMKAVKE